MICYIVLRLYLHQLTWADIVNDVWIFFRSQSFWRRIAFVGITEARTTMYSIPNNQVIETFSGIACHIFGAFPFIYCFPISLCNCNDISIINRYTGGVKYFINAIMILGSFFLPIEVSIQADPSMVLRHLWSFPKLSMLFIHSSDESELFEPFGIHL